jgi:hypothetical protein
MKVYGGVEVQIHIFLTSTLAGGEWSASHPGRFTPGERASGTHWIGGWVDPRAGLDDVKKRKLLTLTGLELRPLGRPARSQSLYRLRYPDSQGPVFISPRNRVAHIYPQALDYCTRQSQSHIATDGQLISKSWCRAPSGAHDQIFITV